MLVIFVLKILKAYYNVRLSAGIKKVGVKYDI